MKNRKTQDPTEAALSAIEDALNLGKEAPEVAPPADRRPAPAAPAPAREPAEEVFVQRQRPSRERPQRRAAANDDRPSVGQIMSALNRKASGTPLVFAVFASILWIIGGALLASSQFRDATGAVMRLNEIVTQTAFLPVLGALLLPPLLFFLFAMLIRRSQEMRNISRAMTEVTLRLAEPEGVSTDAIVSVGQAIRREVAALGDGIERAIARASELETMVRNEVATLERAYDENEHRVRGLVDELHSERDAIVQHSARLREAIAGAHEAFSFDVQNVADRVSAALDTATGALTDNITLRAEDARTNITSAGQTIIDTIMLKADDARSNIATAGETIVNNFAEKSTEATQRLTEVGVQIAQAIADRNQKVSESLLQSADNLSNNLAERAAAINATILESGQTFENTIGMQLQNLADTVLTRGNEVAVRVSTDANVLGARITEGLQTFDSTVKVFGNNLIGEMKGTIAAVAEASRDSLTAFDERITSKATEVSDSIDARISRIEQTLDTRTASLNETLASRTLEFARTVNDGAKSATEAVDKTIAGMGDYFAGKAHEIANTISERTEKIDETLGQRAMEITETLDSRVNKFEDLVVTRLEGITNTVESKGLAVTDQLVSKVEHVTGNLVLRAAQVTDSLVARTSETADQMLAKATATTDQLVAQANAATDQLVARTNETTEQLVARTSATTDQLVAKANETTEQLVARANETTDYLAARAAATTDQLVAKTNETTEHLVARAAATTDQLVAKTNETTDHVVLRTAEAAERMVAQTGGIGEQLVAKTNEATGQLIARAASVGDAVSARIDTTSNLLRENAAAVETHLNDLADGIAKNFVERVNHITGAHETLRTEVRDILQELGSTHRLLQATIDTASSTLGPIENKIAEKVSAFHTTLENSISNTRSTAERMDAQIRQLNEASSTVLRDVSNLTLRFEEQVRLVGSTTEALNDTHRRIDQSLTQRRDAIENVVDLMFTRTNDLEERITRFNTLLEDTFGQAQTRAHEVAKLVAETTANATQSITQQYELIRNSSSEERDRTNAALKSTYNEAMESVNALFADANSRFVEATRDLREIADDIQRTLDSTREEVRRTVFDLPAETKESAAAMRRVVADQIKALSELNDIVARHGRAPENVALAGYEYREEEVAAASGGGRIGSRAAQPRLPRPDYDDDMPPPRPRAEAPEPRRPDRSSEGRGARLTEVLTKPAREPEPAPIREEGTALESLDSLSIDIARMIDHEAAADAWDRFKRGESGVFTRRLYTNAGQKTFEEIRRKYRRSAEFRDTVDRYIDEFERLLEQVSRDDRGQALTRTYLTSDTGKVYTLLAHAAGRLG